MSNQSFAESVRSFLGISFKAGGTEIDGYDCIGLVVRLCQMRGMYFPEKFGKWHKENYHELYEKDPKGSIQVMIAFFDSFAKRLDVNQIVAGDLLVIKQPKDAKFPAVYTGNRNAIASFIKKGVSVFHIDELNSIEFAWRLRCQQQQL